MPKSAFLIAIIALLGFGVISYNGMVTLREQVEQGRADIDAQLNRRADLIPNLVETVKGFTNHESDVFKNVTESRQKLMSAQTMTEKSEANEQMTQALGRLFAIAESYPELKSDKVYTGLMDELAGTENRIAYAREKYNKHVKEYNTSIKTLPNSLYARSLGFEPDDFFKSTEAATQLPKVDFKSTEK